jgi:hypothetical protein
VPGRRAAGSPALRSAAGRSRHPCIVPSSSGVQLARSEPLPDSTRDNQTTVPVSSWSIAWRWSVCAEDAVALNVRFIQASSALANLQASPVPFPTVWPLLLHLH